MNTKEEARKLLDGYNTVKETNGNTGYWMNSDGKVFGDGYERDGKVYQTDAYGGIWGTYTLNVDCWRVVRNRKTYVYETWDFQ